MSTPSRVKAAVRGRLQSNKLGSSVYFVYGKVRGLPARLHERGSWARNDVRARMGGAPEWEAPLAYQWRAILRRSRRDLPLPRNEGGPRVLLGTGYGFNPFVTGLHAMLAVALRLRGAASEFLVCDKALPACDWNQYGNMDPDPGEFGPGLPRALGLSRCRQCTAALDDVYGLLGLPVRTLRSHAVRGDLTALEPLVEGRGPDDLRALIHRGVPVGEHAAATTARLLMRGTIEEGNPHHLWLLRRETLGAAVAAELLSALLDDERPDCVVMQHGIYVTHGVLSDLARLKGIRVVVHEWSDRKDTFIWSHGQTTHRELLEEPVAAWENLDLREDQERRLDEYLDSKRFSGMDWMCHYPSPDEDWLRIADRLGLGPTARIVALFTNTMWDGQIVYRGVAFASMLDWVLHTVEYARRRPDLTFVIREHPGEVRVWGRSGQRLPDEVARAAGQIPPNVIWVMADDDASSYTLAANAEACIVYGTKLGLELAVRGYPVVVVGNAFVRGKGITYDAASPEEYERILERVPGLPKAEPPQIERARRYAYHYYFRRVVEIPLLSMQNPAKGTKAKLEFRTVRELRPGGHRILDAICDGILDGRPFVFEDPAVAAAGRAP